MKVRLKIDSRWLELEQKSMSKMKKDYESWESETLRQAKEAKDLRSLREVFYQLGDRWEWDQATGAWLSSGEPLDMVGLILRMPGLDARKERYVVYGVMAYSKGLTDQFDHLGDKERIIIERSTETGNMYCWSTTGHGALDLFPTDVTKFDTVEGVLDKCHLVAQPGDHALRLEIPRSERNGTSISQLIWEIASGNKSWSVKCIEVLDANEIEEALDFKFYRYAQAVIQLEKAWRNLSRGTIGKAKEVVLDEVPKHLEERNKETLRRIEGLLHILWFKPPVMGYEPAKRIHDELESEPTPTELQQDLLPYLGELSYSLYDIIEKAKYLKWKSVIDSKSFDESDVFQGLNIPKLGKQALAVALDDILREHTLSYIGYPERATIKNKLLRSLFGIAVLPVRIMSSFSTFLKNKFRRFGVSENNIQTDQEKMTAEDSTSTEEPLGS